MPQRIAYVFGESAPLTQLEQEFSIDEADFEQCLRLLEIIRTDGVEDAE